MEYLCVLPIFSFIAEYERKVYMKKFLSLLLAATISLGSAACGKKSAPPKNQTASGMKTALINCSGSEIDMCGDFSSMTALCSSPSSGKILVLGETEPGKWVVDITDSNFSTPKSFQIFPSGSEKILSAALLSNDKIGILTYINGSICVRILNCEGEEETLLFCGEQLVPDENGDIQGRIIRSGSGFLIWDLHDEIFSFDGSGKYLGQVDLKGMNIIGIGESRNGGASVLLQGKENCGYIAEISGSELISRRKCSPFDSTAIAMCPGVGSTELAVAFTDGIYILDGEDWVKWSEFTDLPFDSFNILSMIMTGENEFAILAYTQDGTAAYLVSERKNDQSSPKKTVKIAAIYDTGYISNMIRDYNNANPDGEYFMEIINYTNQQDTGKSAEDLLKMDIVSGSAPDLITTPLNGIDLNGYYLDLYEYIDKDPGISREDFIPNILDAISQDGKLPYIIPSFEIKTMLTKAKFPYIKRNWNYDEFISAYKSMPEGMRFTNSFDNNTMRDNFTNLVNIYDFVDYKKGECSFDSPDFVNMLDLFRDEHLGLTQVEHENFDYENFQREDPMDVSNEKILTPGVYKIMDFQQIWTFMSYFDEAAEFVGLPSRSGNGSFAVSGINNTELSIPRNAAEPDGAWDFVKFFFSENGYKAHRLTFPVLQEHFDRTADHCLENEPGTEDMAFLPEDGWITAVRYLDPEGNEYEVIDPLTEEALQKYKDFVYDAAKNYYRSDSELEPILYVELNAFFNSDKPAKETAELIQNRASIYLSETYE